MLLGLRDFDEFLLEHLRGVMGLVSTRSSWGSARTSDTGEGVVVASRRLARYTGVSLECTSAQSHG